MCTFTFWKSVSGFRSETLQCQSWSNGSLDGRTDVTGSILRWVTVNFRGLYSRFPSTEVGTSSGSGLNRFRTDPTSVGTYGALPGHQPDWTRGRGRNRDQCLTGSSTEGLSRHPWYFSVSRNRTPSRKRWVIGSHLPSSLIFRGRVTTRSDWSHPRLRGGRFSDRNGGIRSLGTKGRLLGGIPFQERVRIAVRARHETYGTTDGLTG